VNEIDHINNHPDDNRWINLREANRQQQQANTLVLARKKLKLKCVNRPIERYRARISVDGHRIHLGRFETAQKACAAYIAAAKQYGVGVNPRCAPFLEKTKYRSVIRVANRTISLGYFETPEAAHTAYCIAAKKYFGEFANGG
jgi:hypothetical protein